MWYDSIAKNAILRIVKTPEEAQEVVAYLSSVDWRQAFLDAQESEYLAIQWEIENIAKKLEKVEVIVVNADNCILSYTLGPTLRANLYVCLI